ncbi:MAG: hypothetical protein ACRD5L_01020 [Bryobacteraceae bacterium]
MTHEIAEMEWIPVVWAFGWVALLLAFYHLRTLRKRGQMELIHKERMIAMEKGIPLPELPEYESKQPRRLLPLNPRWPLGLGAISIMTGAGATLAMRLSGDPYQRQVWPMGIIGVFFGVGLILHYYLTRSSSR